MIDGRNIHLDAGRAGHSPGKRTPDGPEWPESTGHRNAHDTGHPLYPPVPQKSTVPKKKFPLFTMVL